MQDIKVSDIVQAVKGRLLCGNPEWKIEHISIDSRVSEGRDLFVPIIGARVDAHQFIGQAFASGCLACFTSEHSSMEDPEHAWIAVEDTVEALHQLGALCRSRVRIPAVGVTGSVGKTTTREMIACALSAQKRVFRTGKNYNSSVGLPITLSQLSSKDEIAILELGMNVPGELGMIAELAEPQMAVITNVGVAHIEFYGSKEAICREKLSITRGFGTDGLLFLNGDDPLLYEYRGWTGYPYILYGTGEPCEYRAENIHMQSGKLAFELVCPQRENEQGERRLPVVLSVLGRHNVGNAVAALAVADHCGVELEAAAAALDQFTGFQNRLERQPVHGYTVIDDTYNASPDSMIAGVGVLEDYPESGKKYAVLGEMLELGEHSAAFHEQVGEAIAGKKIDELIVVGEQAEQIAVGAQRKGAAYPCIRMEDNAKTAAYLKEKLKPGDVLYLKASNAKRLKEITESLRAGETA